MNEERVNQLKKFLSEAPNDPFVKYALALEFIEEQPEQSEKYFRDLLDHHPDYLPAYFHAADLFVDLEEYDEAKITYEKGIELSRKQKDQKTLAELQNAYQNFLFEMD